jgi:hypothetical protein
VPARCAALGCGAARQEEPEGLRAITLRYGRFFLAVGMLLARPQFCAAQHRQQDQGPAFLGFHHFYKCPSDADVDVIGDTVTPKACLAACMTSDMAAGCWWLDGTGGFPRQCRICKTFAPRKMSWSNDWALSLSALVASTSMRTLPKS